MRSQWIEYKGKKILFQDFSGLFFNSQAVKEELLTVQSIVIKEPPNSVLVLSNFSDTTISSDLMPVLNASSKMTKDHALKTAVIGVTGVKRTLGDLLSRLTGQQLMYFSNIEDAKDWLVHD
jgi:hypothetical protein